MLVPPHPFLRAARKSEVASLPAWLATSPELVRKMPMSVSYCFSARRTGRAW